MPTVNKVKINNETYNFDVNIKTINGNSIKGEGNLEVAADNSATLLWSGSKSITSTSWTSYTTLLTNAVKNYSVLFFMFGQDSVQDAKIIVPVALPSGASGNSSGGSVGVLTLGTGSSQDIHAAEVKLYYTEIPTVSIRRAWSASLYLEKIYAL